MTYNTSFPTPTCQAAPVVTIVGVDFGSVASILGRISFVAQQWQFTGLVHARKHPVHALALLGGPIREGPGVSAVRRTQCRPNGGAS